MCPLGVGVGVRVQVVVVVGVGVEVRVEVQGVVVFHARLSLRSTPLRASATAYER